MTDGSDRQKEGCAELPARSGSNADHLSPQLACCNRIEHLSRMPRYASFVRLECREAGRLTARGAKPILV
jgi:hypothetical protein